MSFFAMALADRGFAVVRFEFPYMIVKRTGRSKPPDREPVLREPWLKVVEKVGRKGSVIGGKSMEGRIASLVADGAGVAVLICLGYPFHPVGKPNKLRVEHLRSIKTPTLILQGERDPFAMPRSHDEHYFANPPQMIDGMVRPPRTELRNETNYLGRSGN